jgi:hypothetical protein
MAMKIQKVKLSDIFPYYNNPRDNANAVEPVIESLKKFGFIKPIMVDKNMVIICGHTRYIAAYQAGCEFVPIIVSDMPEEQAKRFRILDNKIAEKSSFDENELIEELKKMEAPKEMQAFFFEDIDMMLNFSLDQFNQQVDAAGGFADMSDYNQGDDYHEDENPYGSASDEDGDNFNEQYDDENGDDEEDPADGLFQTRMRPDGSKYMKVVCPYCGNIEEIDIE